MKMIPCTATSSRGNAFLGVLKTVPFHVLKPHVISLKGPCLENPCGTKNCAKAASAASEQSGWFHGALPPHVQAEMRTLHVLAILQNSHCEFWGQFRGQNFKKMLSLTTRRFLSE